jgi:hypothetical protein
MLQERIEFLNKELKFKVLEWCIDLPGMTAQKLAALEACSSAEVIGAELVGFVSHECMDELHVTFNRVAALTNKVRSFEPAQGRLPRQKSR